MTKKNVWLASHKFWLQTLAFLLIMLPPIGLYYSVTYDVMWVTWILMGVIAAGMIVAILVT